jgi:hypothetical protein
MKEVCLSRAVVTASRSQGEGRRCNLPEQTLLLSAVTLKEAILMQNREKPYV